MIRFLKDGALIALSEQPTWVCLLENGTYGLCSREEAQGVVIGGTVYNIDGNVISQNGDVAYNEVSNGEFMMQQDKIAAQNAANLDYLSMMTGFDLPTAGAQAAKEGGSSNE
nr:MAG TPA: hypothetical protein [Caudoviricetes sp.]